MEDGPVVERETSKRTRRLVFVGIAVVAGAAAIASYITRSDTQPEPRTTDQRTTVAEFSGDGDLVTETFDVDHGWQIHWETEGSSFAFAITGGFDYGTIVKEKGTGSGVTSPVGAGTFRLEVDAKGPWSVRIIQGAPPENTGRNDDPEGRSGE